MPSKAPDDLGPTVVDDHGSARDVSAPPPVLAAPAPVEQGFEMRYELRRVLGEGGMGEVRLCKDARIGREVAVKMIRPELQAELGLVARFFREARVQGTLEHPSIVPVYDLGAGPNGAAYFTMKRVRGMTLAEVLDKLRARDPQAAHHFTRRKLLSAFANVCLAVEFAHAHGVLHRDLKPENVMLGSFGEVYVLDWGVAKIIADADEASDLVLAAAQAQGGATSAGATLGTLGYMSPEQLEGKPVDARTDIYALGAMLFEILTLEPLHRGTFAEVAASTLRAADARARLRAPDENVAPELERLCVAATARDPGARLGSAREMSDAIEHFLEGDRDTELRRGLAAQHAEAAAAEAYAALAGREDAAMHRAAAMREAGRALALDPANERAQLTMSRLLLEPPTEAPPEARAVLEARKRATIGVSARVGGLVFASWIFWLPFIVAMGVKSWAWIGACSLFCVLGVLVSTAQARAPDPRRSYVTILVSALMFVCLSRLFGPLALVPCAAMALALTFALYPYAAMRRAAVVASCLSVAAPLALEWAGLLPRSYSFERGAMVIHPQMSALPEGPSTLALIVFQTALIVGMWRLASNVRQALLDAEERLAVQAWHLEKLIPATVGESSKRRGPSDRDAGVKA